MNYPDLRSWERSDSWSRMQARSLIANEHKLLSNYPLEAKHVTPRYYGLFGCVNRYDGSRAPREAWFGIHEDGGRVLDHLSKAIPRVQ